MNHFHGEQQDLIHWKQFKREEAEERIATNEANGVAVKVQGYIPKRNPRIEAHNEGLGGL